MAYKNGAIFGPPDRLYMNYSITTHRLSIRYVLHLNIFRLDLALSHWHLVLLDILHQDRMQLLLSASLFTDRKLHTCFRFLQKSVTLNFL